MSQSPLTSDRLSVTVVGRRGLVWVLVASNLLFNVIANASFKLSAESRHWRGFLFWQLIGNLAGFATVLLLTALLRHMPLQVAYPLTTGLAVVGVQVFAARLLFHQPITPLQWVGTLLIVAGIICIGGR